MNFEDYETLPTSNVSTHMTAGAIAGIMEHCVMYPLDSVKTRMQSLTAPMNQNTIGETFLRMVRTEGIMRPIRGMSAVVAGAGPAHALYFSSYEYLKNWMVQRSSSSRYHTLVYGGAGCIATLLHDGVMNPAEVVKQRLQMYNSPYKSVMECVRKIYSGEGLKAFYRSYTTQLTMNVPFQSIHFITYELMQNVTNKERNYNPSAHVVSGAIAGAVAAAFTTPLDVCKTLLNTQQANTKVQGLSEAIKLVYRLGGPTGFFKGMQARVLYQMPATAICWSTYEFFKYALGQSRLEERTTHTEGLTNVPQSAAIKMLARTQETGETLMLKPRELPSMSGAGLYGTVSFNTVHTNDTSPIRKGNTLLDIKYT